MRKILCDRCGRQIQNVLEISKAEFYKVKMTDERSEYYGCYELCGRCYRKLKRFMKKEDKEDGEDDRDTD